LDGKQEIPREESSEEKLEKELKKEQFSAKRIAELTQEIAHTNSANALQQLGSLLSQFGGQFSREALFSETPFVTYTKSGVSKVAAIETHLRARAISWLEKTVDRDKIVLLPFLFSSDALSVIKSDIPSERVAHGLLIDRVVAGEFEQVDLRVFRSLQGKNVVAVGHVEVKNGVLSFEVRRKDGQNRYIAIDKLLEVSKKIGFNLIPLGCETAEKISLGVSAKINDLDALSAFRRSIAKRGRSTFGEVLRDMASEDIQFHIDLTRLADENLLPFNLIDKNETPLSDSYTGNHRFSATNGYMPPDIDAESSDLGANNEPSDRTIINSKFLQGFLDVARQFWCDLLFVIFVFGLSLASFEVLLIGYKNSEIFVSFVTVFIFAICSVFWCFVFLALQCDNENSLLAQLGGALISFGIYSGLVELYPEYIWSKRAAISGLLWSQIAAFVAVADTTAEWLGLLVEPMPI
jgi:hypothetical protein